MRLRHHRHPAAAGRDQHVPRPASSRIGCGLDEPERQRRGHEPPPPPRPHLPVRRAPSRPRSPSRPRVVVRRPDRLGRRPERRVGRVHDHLGDQRQHLLPQPAPAQRGAERLGQQVAELALGGGAADVHRHRRHLQRGGLLLQQQPADLRPVAVGQHQGDAGADQLGQRDGGGSERGAQLGRRTGPARRAQRVTAQGDHHPHRLPTSLGPRRVDGRPAAARPRGESSSSHDAAGRRVTSPCLQRRATTPPISDPLAVALLLRRRLLVGAGQRRLGQVGRPRTARGSGVDGVGQLRRRRARSASKRKADGQVAEGLAAASR